MPPPPTPVPPTPEPPPPAVAGIVNYQPGGVIPAQVTMYAGERLEFLNRLNYAIDIESYDSPEIFHLSLPAGGSQARVLAAAGTYHVRRADLPADAQWYVTIVVR